MMKVAERSLSGASLAKYHTQTVSLHRYSSNTPITGELIEVSYCYEDRKGGRLPRPGSSSHASRCCGTIQDRTEELHTLCKLTGSRLKSEKNVWLMSKPLTIHSESSQPVVPTQYEMLGILYSHLFSGQRLQEHH